MIHPTARVEGAAAIVDEILSETEFQRLFSYALSREADFIPTRILGSAIDAVPRVNPNIRRNLHLKGTGCVPDWVLTRIKSALDDVAPVTTHPDFHNGYVVEAEITATQDRGFFAPHVDDGNPSVRDRTLSFVLFFSDRPPAFTGGELCIERPRRDEDGLYIFDAIRDGTLGHPGIATTITPVPNRLAVFPSNSLHEIRTVKTSTPRFRSSRFSVTGFVRQSPSAMPANEAGPQPHSPCVPH